MQIRTEERRDQSAIRELHRAAFPSDAEARLVDALRLEGFSRVSLVAEVSGVVVGHILLSEISIVLPDRVLPALSLAPLAVLPERQRQGIGSALIERSLSICRSQEHALVILLGEPEFYRRFGFSTELAEPLECEYAGDYFMALELTPGAIRGLRGRVEYSPPFASL